MASRGLSRGVIALIVADVVLVLVLIALIVTHPSTGPAEPEENAAAPQATEPAEPSPEPEQNEPADEAPEETAPEEPPEEALDEPAFVTPSGNIWCELDADGATCTIGGYEYGVPDQPDCDGHTGRVLQVTEAEATMPCVEQEPPTSAPESHVELDYGESTMVGNFLCASAETGVSCRSMADGHGFELAYADYDIF